MLIKINNIGYLVLIPVIIILAVIVCKKIIKNDRYSLTSTILRTFTIIVLILSLSGVSLTDKARNTTTLYLVDVSDSAKNSLKESAEFVEKAESNKGNGDKTAVAIFAGKTVTTIAPTDEYVTVNLESQSVNKEVTNIESAVKQAANIFGNDTKKRLVIVSDGLETAGDAISVRNLIKSENIQTLIYNSGGTVNTEVGIREIALPQYVNINMNYDVNVIVDSVGSQRGTLRLYRGSVLVLNEKVELNNGENRFVFTDKAEKGGGITYHAEIIPENDTFYENNSIYGYCYAENLPAVLVVGKGESATNMQKLLESAQLKVDVVSPDKTPLSYDELTAYDSIVLADVSYEDMNSEFVTALDSFVKYAGGGLITIGGENSYGPGGYSGTILEEMLPVEMEVKTQSEDPDLAMVMVIDRSGSMEDGSQGRSCMEIAKEAAFRGVQELNDDDLVGVVAFDSQGQWVVDLKEVGPNIDDIKTSIGQIQPGGGTSILPALRMACNKLSETDAKIKHIILLTDGQAEQEGYGYLMGMAKEDGITISTIAVGKGADTDLLQYIADEGRGRYYYADQFSTLPEIFVYETSIASKDYINNEDFYPSAVDDSEITENIESVPILHGYVSTTAKPRANIVLESEKKEPILATWQYGLGRTASWTSDLSGQWTDEWIASEEGLDILRNLISYSMRSDILYDIEVKGESNGGVSTVTVKLPVNQNTTGVSANIIAENGEEYKADMSASLPGEYVCTIPTEKEGAYIITINENLSDGESNVYNAGFILGYSKEYDARSFNGNGIINEISSYDGIRQINSPEEVYENEPEQSYAKKDISVKLIVLALILFILDILLRRFPEIIDRVYAFTSDKIKLIKNNIKTSNKKESKEFNNNKASKVKTDKTVEKTEVKEIKKETVSSSSSSKLADIKRNRRK